LEINNHRNWALCACRRKVVKTIARRAEVRFERLQHVQAFAQPCWSAQQCERQTGEGMSAYRDNSSRTARLSGDSW
jgi:hypothetical protein